MASDNNNNVLLSGSYIGIAIRNILSSDNNNNITGDSSNKYYQRTAMQLNLQFNVLDGRIIGEGYSIVDKISPEDYRNINYGYNNLSIISPLLINSINS